jgi:hypothetical protein
LAASFLYASSFALVILFMGFSNPVEIGIVIPPKELNADEHLTLGFGLIEVKARMGMLMGAPVHINLTP